MFTVEAWFQLLRTILAVSPECVGERTILIKVKRVTSCPSVARMDNACNFLLTVSFINILADNDGTFPADADIAHHPQYSRLFFYCPVTKEWPFKL